MSRVVALLLIMMGSAGCASGRPASMLVAAGATRAAQADTAACANCATSSLGVEIVTAMERRLADLKARGGECAVYGAVLENSYRSGQIIIRPFMWRVGPLLASGEATSDGQMILARHIDSLNVGVRTPEDVIWSMEHEAAHIAFGISNGTDAAYDRANARVRECR